MTAPHQKPLCDICGKPATQYPNWILSHGEQMHVGCMASSRRDLLDALNTIATANESEFGYDKPHVKMIEFARAAIAIAKGQS